MTEKHPHDAFIEADAEFRVACRAYNEAADTLSAATRRRQEAWRKLSDPAEGISRCEITNNPVGTDTWAVGYECRCKPCQQMLTGGAVAR